MHKKRNGTTPAFEATVNYIHAIEPLVRLELKNIDQTDLFEAELAQESFRQLNIIQRENFFVYPRTVHIFIKA